MVDFSKAPARYLYYNHSLSPPPAYLLSCIFYPVSLIPISPAGPESVYPQIPAQIRLSVDSGQNALVSSCAGHPNNWSDSPHSTRRPPKREGPIVRYPAGLGYAMGDNDNGILLLSSRSISSITADDFTSRAEQGSSSNSTSGSTVRARAIQSLCCCPPRELQSIPAQIPPDLVVQSGHLGFPLHQRFQGSLYPGCRNTGRICHVLINGKRKGGPASGAPGPHGGAAHPSCMDFIS